MNQKIEDVLGELNALNDLIRQANAADEPALNDWAGMRAVQKKISQIGGLACGIALSGETLATVAVRCPAHPIPAKELGELAAFLSQRGIRL